MNPMGPSWDAGLYDDRHAFVWQYGASLVELLAPQSGERILDLGCGTGHLTAQIAHKGATVVGMDRSEEMLTQARQAYPHLEFVSGDARSFTFLTPFDAVFSNAVLHWVKEPTTAIRAIRHALKPGGRLVAELGGKGNVARLLAAMRWAGQRVGVDLDQPLWFFPSVGEYASLLEADGLEVRFATLFDRPTPLEGTNGLRNWVRMFASQILDALSPEQHEDFLRVTEETARSSLYHDGKWIADYRRLRIVAVRGM